MAATGDERTSPRTRCDVLRADAEHGDARREEAERLGDRVPGHLIGGAEMRVGAAESGSDQDDPHMLDRREGEHPLEVADIDQEQGRDATDIRPKPMNQGRASSPGAPPTTGNSRRMT